jgi:hypothetical protein
MSDPSTPAAPADADSDALRIVLFGLPAAGKSSLLGALAQAAAAQEHLLGGRLKDLTRGLDELRQRLYDETPRRTTEEVVPYPVDYEPFARGAAAAKEHTGAVLIDCDGRVANDLLVRHPAADDTSPEGTLAHEMAGADTLVLVIDASAPLAQVDADFTEFDRFLRQMERGRGRRAEIGGLPVFLVLTKCDLLAGPGDGPAAWIERIEQRKRDVDGRFRAFLARREREAGPLPFGRINLHVWATAVKRPALVGAPARPREPYGVAELFRQCLQDAATFRDSRRRSSRRLLWTAGGAAGILAVLGGLAIGQMMTGSGGRLSPLQVQVEELRFADKATAAERLRAPERDLARRLDALIKVRNEPGFEGLPAQTQKFVHDRIDELQSYLGYLHRLRAERRPGDVTTLQALQELQERLQTELALPSPEWQDTEAGELRRQRLQDAEALRKAVGRARDWYLDATEKANDLWTFRRYQGGPDSAGIDWQAWSRQADQLLDPNRRPPFTETETIPGAATGLTYATALRFDRVVDARTDWETDRKRLGRLLDLAAALGLATAKGRPPVLVMPRDPTLAIVAQKRQELQKAYPDYEKQFVLEGLPDAVRPKVRQVARTNYEALLELGRAEVLRQLQQAGSGTEETPVRWQAVREWLRQPRELASWRVLAVVLARLHDPDAPDPVDDLAEFLGRTSFPIAIERIVLEVPDSSRARPAPAAPFSVYHQPPAGEAPALVLEPSGEGERDPRGRVWRYVYRLASGQRLTFHPGDRFWASLPQRDDLVLTWARERSAMYRFECLRRPPRLHKAGEANTEGSLQEGVRLTIHPEDGVPRVPDLLPVVRLEK